MKYQHGVSAIALVVVAVLVAAAFGTISFWTAMGVTACFCAFAAVESVRWYREYRRVDDARLFFQHELDRMPHRPEPTRQQVLMHATQFPAAWQPFVIAPRPPKFNEADRQDWPVQVHAR